MAGAVEDVTTTAAGVAVTGCVDEGAGGTVVVWVDDVLLGACATTDGSWRLDAAADPWVEPRAVTAALVGTDVVVALRPLTAAVREDPLPGWVDSPADGDVVVAPLLRVAGWLLPPPGFQRLDVAVSGLGTFRARCFAGPRPDIERISSAPAACVAQWEALIHLPVGIGPSSLDVDVTAVGAGWRVPLGGVGTVAVQPADRGDAVESRVPAPPARPSGDVATVAIHTHNLDIGGAQFHLLELLRGLRGRGRYRFVLVPQAGGRLWSAFAEVAEVWMASGLPPADAGRYDDYVSGLGAVLAAAAPHVVLANTAGAFPAVDWAVRAGVPVAWAIHENLRPDVYLAITTGGDPQVVDRLGTCVDEADALVFESQATLDMWRTDANAMRCHRSMYGVDVGACTAAAAALDRGAVRASLGYRDDDVVLLVTGVFGPRKNQAMTAVAFAEVAASHPEANLVLLGDSGGTYASATRRVADGLGLGPRLRIEPTTLDVAPWYVAADASILASDLESLPRTIMESMANQLPVLSTIVGGIPELITDGREGFLVPANDFGLLVEALERLLSMPSSERRAMGAAGRRRIEVERDGSQYAARWHDLLAGLVGSRS